jgi:hypothetical protein
MLRFKLRTLLIVLALGPVVIAAGWRAWGQEVDWQEIYERETFRLEYAGKLWRMLGEKGTHFGD